MRSGVPPPQRRRRAPDLLSLGSDLLRVRFKGGTPVSVDDFLSGFEFATRRDAERSGQPAPTYVFGRPAGIVMAHDGALLVSDDANGIIYRIAYPGRAAMSRTR